MVGKGYASSLTILAAGALGIGLFTAAMAAANVVSQVLLATAAGGPVRFAGLVAAACYPAIARAFAIHLTWHRVLAVDLAVPFGDSALVWRGAARSGQ